MITRNPRKKCYDEDCCPSPDDKKVVLDRVTCPICSENYPGESKHECSDYPFLAPKEELKDIPSEVSDKKRIEELEQCIRNLSVFMSGMNINPDVPAYLKDCLLVHINDVSKVIDNNN